MPPELDRRRSLLAVAVAALLLAAAGPSVNALPGFSDHTGPTELRVASFERAGAGCAEEFQYAASSTGGGRIASSGTVTAAGPDADLSVWTERTSPPGADLSTFRVHLDTHGGNEAATDCETAVGYRLSLTLTGGSDEGLLPDAHGYRVLWLENGRYAGCSASVTSPLSSGCQRFAERPDRAWANGSASA
ncbi:hypothetical protein [Haloarcula litorea]|uniref:hypothetical protein n=1 Tax=Haloarcula litorea TaxID=3032579 RepID=UPI0023E8B302|nr:hypothetical protein [Halomicroarcula sp. GDY20]